MGKRMEHRTVRIQNGPDKRKTKAINTKTITMLHPISTKKGLAIERRTLGTENLRGKIVKISEMVFVTKWVQKAEDPRRETVETRGKRGSAPFPLSGQIQ